MVSSLHMATETHQQRVTKSRMNSTEEFSSSQTERNNATGTCCRVMNPFKPTSFRNKIQIQRDEMEQYFYFPQRLAAQKLGVSLSTLKRRFYQLDIGRWPYQLTQDKRRRSVWHLVNEEESRSEKELCPNTVQTLTRLFSMSIQEQQLLAIQYDSQRNSSINGNGPRNIKFFRYVPRGGTSAQSPNQCSIHSPSSKQGTKKILNRERRFLQLDVGTSTSDGSMKGETNRKHQKMC